MVARHLTIETKAFGLHASSEILALPTCPVFFEAVRDDVQLRERFRFACVGRNSSAALLFSFRGGVAFDSVRQDGRDTLSAPVRPQTRLDADSVS